MNTNIHHIRETQPLPRLSVVRTPALTSAALIRPKFSPYARRIGTSASVRPSPFRLDGCRGLAKALAVSFVLTGLLAWCATPASATDRHWTGAVSGNWSEPNNWNPAGIPQNGEDLYIDGNSHTTMMNDLVNLVIDYMSFPQNTDYTLNGNSLTVTGFYRAIVLVPNGSATVNINCPLIFTNGGDVHAAPQFGNLTDNTGSLYLNGNISVNAGALNLHAYSGTETLSAAGIGYIYVRGSISGSGEVHAISEDDGDPHSFVEFDVPLGSLFTGTLYLATYKNSRVIFNSTGGPVVTGNLAAEYQSLFAGQAIHLVLNQPDQIGHSTVVTIAAGSQLLPTGNDATIGSLVLTNVSSDALPSILDTGSTTWTLQNGITNWVDNSAVVPAVKGKLALATGGRAFSINGTGYAGLEMQAQLSGAGGIVQSGNAALLMESSNSFSGQIFVTQGIMDVRNDHALGSTAGATTLTSSGILTLRNVSITGETLNVQGNVPVTAYTTGSQLNTVGTCNWLGPISLSSSLNVVADSLAITGPITGGGGLELSFGNAVLASAGADNTYSGTTYVHCPLAEFENVGHKAFSGPLVVGGPPVGSCEARWLAGAQGNAGNLTVYPNGVVNLNSFNDTFNSLTFNGGLLETGSGQVIVNHNITSNPTNTTATISGNLAFALGDSAFFNIADGPADPDLEVDAAISGTTTKITKEGYGKLTLTGGNSFTGPTDVTQGILEVTTGSAFGDTSAGNTLTVETNATLRLNGSGSSAKAILLNASGSAGTNGAIEVPASGSFTLSGNITLSTPSAISVGQSAGLALSGTISGTGPLTKFGPGILGFGGSAANTYSGDTVATEGTLNLAKPTAVAAVPHNLVIGPAPSGSFATALFNETAGLGGDTVTVDANSTLNLNGFNQTLNYLILNDGGSVQTGSGTLSFSVGGLVSVGSLSLLGSHVGSTISGVLGIFANNTLTFTVGPYSPLAHGSGPELDVPAVIPAPIEQPLPLSPAGIAKSGLGRMRLTANNSYKGGTEITGGTLDVEGSQPRSAVSVFGGTLAGSGTVGLLYPAGGSAIVSPGSSPGILTCSNFNAGASGPGTLQIELNGTTAGSGYDQLTVHGTVNLAGITLNASLNYSSSVGDQFVIINNDGSDAVTGTFIGLAQNAGLSIGGESFFISYTGGSGNDVVLTRTVTTPKPSLTIQSVSPTSVRLLWPTNDPAYSLQSNTNLATTNWSSVSPSPIILGTNNVVTNAASGTQKVYRLTKP